MHMIQLFVEMPAFPEPIHIQVHIVNIPGMGRAQLKMLKHTHKHFIN